METLPLYVIKIGQDYLADYVGLFASQELAMAFIHNIIDEDKDFKMSDFQIILIKPKNEY